MNEPDTDEWRDIARLWQADAARVSPEDIDEHLRRERRHLLGVTVAESSGLAVGLVAALLVLLFTPHVWMGVLIILFGGASAWIALRMRREGAPPGSTGLMQSLKDSIAREDWLEEQLRMGRALSFVALFAIVIAVSVRLQELREFPAATMFAAGVGGMLVCAALVWNLVLTARLRRRRERLEYLEKRLKV